MNFQVFSTGFSSGDFAGSGRSVTLLGNWQLGRGVPTGLIEQHDGVRAGCHGLRYLLDVQGHGVRVAAGQDEAGRLGLGGADGAEDVGRLRALIARRRRSRAAPRPSAGDLVLLAHPGFVLEPDLYGLAAGLARRDLRQERGEVFSNAVSASSSLA
jgi:hypothetical protein